MEVQLRQVTRKMKEMIRDRDEVANEAAKADKQRAHLETRCRDVQQHNKEIKVDSH